jgi:hypothetical protein
VKSSRASARREVEEFLEAVCEDNLDECVVGGSHECLNWAESDYVMSHLLRAAPMVRCRMAVQPRLGAGRMMSRTRPSGLPERRAEIGTEFLIYGTIHDGMLEVGRCLGSGPSNQKIRELEILRQRARPRP